MKPWIIVFLKELLKIKTKPVQLEEKKSWCYSSVNSGGSWEHLSVRGGCPDRVVLQGAQAWEGGGLDWLTWAAWMVLGIVTRLRCIEERISLSNLRVWLGHRKGHRIGACEVGKLSRNEDTWLLVSLSHLVFIWPLLWARAWSITSRRPNLAYYLFL